jgi:hypothetical protein
MLVILPPCIDGDLDDGGPVMDALFVVNGCGLDAQCRLCPKDRPAAVEAKSNRYPKVVGGVCERAVQQLAIDDGDLAGAADQGNGARQLFTAAIRFDPAFDVDPTELMATWDDPKAVANG